MPNTAIIAEDHEVTREGLASVLETKLSIDVVGKTGDGLEAFSLLKTYDPDVLILDLSIPHLNGLDLLHKIEGRDLDANVVVLSMHEKPKYVQEAFERGASAYILKGSPLQELLEAVKKALQESRYLNEDLSEKLDDEDAAADAEENRLHALTDREREVLQLTAEGYTSKEIGEKLHLSDRTIEKHRERIMEKLDVCNAVEMVNVALRRGLIPNPSLTESTE